MDMQVESAGFTMAPLQPSYRRQGVSDSCLCTFVLKVDLGGSLSQSSAVNALFYPWTQNLARSFIDPFLMSVIALRDQVIFWGMLDKHHHSICLMSLLLSITFH